MLSFLNRGFSLRALGALCLGAFAGLAIGSTFLTNFKASARLAPFVHGNPIEDLLQFKQAAGHAFTSERFAEFSSKLAPEERVPALQQRINQENSRWLQFDFNFGLSKADLRELPEIVVRELATVSKSDLNAESKTEAKQKEIEKERNFNSIVGGGTTVVTMDKDRATALKMASVAGQYLSDLVLEDRLRAIAEHWSLEASTDLAKFRLKLLDVQSRLASTTRLISELAALRDKHVSDNGPSAKIESSIQVQVSDPRYLTIAQQISAREVQRVELLEEGQEYENSIAKNEITKAVGDAIGPIVGSSMLASSKLRSILDKFQSEAAKARARSSQDRLLNANISLAAMESVLQELKVRFLDLPPPALWVTQQGPPRWLSTSLGALAGLSLFVFSQFLKRRLAATTF